MSKIQSESNSQHRDDFDIFVKSCDQYVKDTIWKQFTTEASMLIECWSCDQYVKDTIWKQFTTHLSCKANLPGLWPICQRYNLKAIHNSPLHCQSNPAGCDQYVKDTIWKQFTTLNTTEALPHSLWPICQRYNLKAIHNAQG